MPVAGIYVILCVTTGKYYLGSSMNIAARWKDHRYLLGVTRHHSVRLQNAWNKYGVDAFQLITVRQTPGYSQAQLQRLEQQYLDRYQPHIHGYNMNDKADRVTHTAEVRQKLSLANFQRLTPEFRRNLSNNATEHMSTPESRKRSADRAKGNTWRLGMVHTAESKALMSQATSKQWESPEYREKMSQMQRRKVLSQESKDKIGAAVRLRYARMSGGVK